MNVSLRTLSYKYVCLFNIFDGIVYGLVNMGGKEWPPYLVFPDGPSLELAMATREPKSRGNRKFLGETHVTHGRFSVDVLRQQMFQLHWLESGHM